MARIFDRPDGCTKPWDYVFNLGGETAMSQAPEVYKLRSLALSITLGKEAARRGVKAFVEASTGMVYAPSRTPRKETDKLKPWLKLAKCKLEAEEVLSKIPGLNLVILRLAHVYGEYDAGFIAKALCLARVYKEQDRELKWLWTEDLRINTVHVEDIARALWKAAEWRAENSVIPADAAAPGSPTLPRRGSIMNSLSPSSPDPGPQANTPIFNIVDHGNTSQGTLASIISQVFGIKTGFQGSLISQFAKLHLESVVDDLNEDILQPWAEMLAKKGITRPGPLSPFLEKELLKDTDLSLHGGLFERVTGFEYVRMQGLTREGVEEMVESYRRMGWWP
jgi:nucleoside-diphosphate-sugar epimerase